MTLIVFFVFVTSFVAYRVGAFNGEENTQLTNKNESNIQQDTILDADTPTVQHVDSPKPFPAMMSTSKSTVIYDDKIRMNSQNSKVYLQDTSRKKKISKADSSKKVMKRTQIMGSSKAAFIYEPDQDTSKKNAKEKNKNFCSWISIIC
ncbi:MAG TPA: hypothetical protein VNX68_11065 [Nitrosopumilaceae archaeon]|nr:hypothetical protein [Nitrosopumilaceae archaeon]